MGKKSSSWVSLCVALGLMLQGCGAYGYGFRELAWADGWQRMPIGRWLLNDGITAKTLVICPRDICPHMGMVALFEAEGRDALALERALASNKMLSERRAKPQPRKFGGGAAPKPNVTAHTRIDRFMVDGMAATRVELTPQRPRGSGVNSLPTTGNSAYAVVLTQRFGATLKAVLAVTTDADTALRQAKAAAKDW